MVNDGSFVEEIADALGKSVNSIRGKALSLLRSGEINAIPKQKETKGSSKADVLEEEFKDLLDQNKKGEAKELEEFIVFIKKSQVSLQG